LHNQIVTVNCAKESAESPEEPAEHKEKLERARQALSYLNPREALVLRLRYGIGEKRHYTLDEVGDRLMVSRERIRQIEKKTISKLSRNPRIRHLTGMNLSEIRRRTRQGRCGLTGPRPA